MDDLETVHLLLRQARERARLSQPQLADRLGVSVRTVRRHEAGMAALPIGLSMRWMRECGARLLLRIAP